MMSDASKISAVVITENEEERIAACLKALRFCDEIVVVDGGSRDRTREIARAHAAVVIEHPTGEFGLNYNKNLGADRSSGDWILSIDADEIVSPALAAEIRRVAAEGTHKTWRVARKTYLLNHWVRSCNWWPGYVIRLYRRDATKWPPGVHEVPPASGPVGTLEHPLDHYSYPDLGRYILKLEHFSRAEAMEKWERGVRLTPGNAAVNLVVKPVVSVLRKYFLQSGWRDGIAGLFVSVSAGLAVFMNYVRLWEIQSTGRKLSQGDRGR